MNKLDELMALLQKQEKEEEKCKNTVMWVLAITLKMKITKKIKM